MPVRLKARDQSALDGLASIALAMTAQELEAYASRLDRHDLAVLEQALGGRASIGWRSDPASFAHHLDPTYQRYPYVDLLSRKFKEAADGVSKRQIWNMPGRLGKSLLGSQWGPTWQLDRRPTSRFILVGYGHQLAVENAVGIRDRLRDHADDLNVQLRRDRRRMDRFVTDEGGGVLAAGIQGSIRGFGAGSGGGIVIDDPFKNWQDAHSEHKRDLVWTGWQGTLVDRLDDDEAFVLIIHHRVHEDDLTGRLKARMEDGTGEAWDLTVLPALATSADDPLGRALGEPIEPSRFSVSFVQAQAKAMGSYLASGLQQQDPSPEEGTELLRAWFQLYEQAPPGADDRLTSWDLKLKDSEQGDYVVGQLWARTGPDVWLVDQLRGQWDHATTTNAVALMAVRHPECRRHVIEAAGSSDTVIPQLRKATPDYVVTDEMAGRLGMTEDEARAVAALRRAGMGGLVPHPAKGDKSVRARSFIAPAAEAGNVHLPAYADWTPALMDELAAFPRGVHDDQVDAMSQALQRLGLGQATVTAPAGRITTPTGARPVGQPSRRPGQFGGRRLG